MAAAWVRTTLGVLLAILILLAMITIHEFGHYIAGKILKFKIDEFSVGFGPALFKKKGKKSGELFAVRLLPLGGYCAFHGEDGLDEEEEPTPLPPSTGGGEEELPLGGELSPQATEEGTSKAEGVRPETQSASCPPESPRHPERSEGSPQTQSTKRLHYTDDGSFTNMKPWKRIIVLVAGATMNYLLALLLILICFLSYGQTMLAVYKMEDGGYDAEYSLQDCDILLKAEGKDLYLTTDIAKALNGKKKGDLVELYVSRAIGLKWVDVGEGNLVPKCDDREKMTVKIMLRDDVTVKNSEDLDPVWRALGIACQKTEEGETYMLASGLQELGFFEAVGRSFVYSFKLAGSIFKVIGELFTGKLGINTLGGPVTTVRLTSEIATQGIRNFLEIAALIGVNLAVFNLLPIPALDGSKVVFTVIEWIRGKPISRKIEAIIHAVGFVLLIGFAILVDVLQFV